MAKLIIQAGRPLTGSVRLSGAKNSSYKLMIASLLGSQENRLSNFTNIADIDLVKQIITALGAKVRSVGKHTMIINPQTITNSVIPQKLGAASRASTLFLAPLLARTKQAIVPLPGGDQIGNRPLDRHFNGLKALGVNISLKQNQIIASCDQLIGANYCFPKNSHTGTETLIMAAVLAKGKTVIGNAALEPEVDDLISMLKLMGAQIFRKPNRVIQIQGVKQLNPVSYQVMPDRNEAVTFAIAAYLTQGDITVTNSRPDHLQAFLSKLDQAGGKYQINGSSIRFFFTQPLTAVNITTQPHPGFMTDWQPLWSVLATQSLGTSKIIEAVFPSRFQYVANLKAMAANIDFFDPQPKNPDKFYNFNLQDNQQQLHAIKVTGPTPLQAGSFAIPDIRAGATLVLAGLTAKGTTILTNIEHINRGYEDFDGRLLQLGAKIKRTN